MQSKPAIRTPKPCGRDDWPAHGRNPSQLGWYEFVARRENKNAPVLDVGAGIGAGVAYMRYLGMRDVVGFDTDTRLENMPDMYVGDSALKLFLMFMRYEVVTCIDVIEHVANDLQLFDELRQLSLMSVYISTPNRLHSGCLNEHHAREYTVAEFVAAFKPDEIWGGSSDGWVRERLTAPYSEEFPSMCGVFHAA
jgi:2-polyprenyl-3-methyl-5-hydroxy-6-metoxy-1,4-benzoquinol methylase